MKADPIRPKRRSLDLDDQKRLREVLERELNELADIIVEFYREWKQQ